MDTEQRDQAEHHRCSPAIAELQRSNTELSQFASVAAHELRAPLGIVSGYLELLGLRPAVALDPGAVELADQIHAGVAHMRMLIDDLLAYSSIGRDPDRRSAVDLQALALDAASPLLARPGTTIRIGELPTVTGDPVQLRQLFDNLLSNAAKAVEGGPWPLVTVTARELRDKWRIEVTDNGIGIPAAHRERVFTMFERVPRVDDVPGSGIGLAICRRLVERHGGRIWIEDNAPAGTRVCFTLSADR